MIAIAGPVIVAALLTAAVMVGLLAEANPSRSRCAMALLVTLLIGGMVGRGVLWWAVAVAAVASLLLTATTHE